MNEVSRPDPYARMLTGAGPPPPKWQTLAQGQVHDLVSGCAAEFATRCCRNPHPKFSRDAGRRPVLQYGRGLGEDEAAAFLRAIDAGLVSVDEDGHFSVPGVRACSPNLHLVGRNEDHVVLHTEVLVHLGAYAELVLDDGWDPQCIAFDPFIHGAALDLWGYDAPRAPGANWWEGRIIFAAEAKARVLGADSLTSLARAFERLATDNDAVVNVGHRRKWEELIAIGTRHGSIDLLLVADGARWWYRVDVGPRIKLTRTR